MAPHICDDNNPCLVAPSPGLQARFRAQKTDPLNSKLAVYASQKFLRHDSNVVGAPTGTKLGLNDGVIFPKKHFTKAPSKSALVRAAAERAPLRGAIKYVIL